MGINRNMWRGGTRDRVFLSLVALLCVLAAASGARAQTSPVVLDARVGVHPGSTRLVLEMSVTVAYKIFTLADPYRVVIDFPEVAWRVPRTRMRASAGLVAQFRFGLFQPGNSRVVIDTTVRRQSPPAAHPAANGRRVVVLDPGHGGVDPGTIGVSGTYEKYITLAVAKAAKRILEASGRYRVVLTRTRDVYVRLRNRFETAHRNKAELFLSLHADSMPNKKIRGGSIYTLSDKASDKEAEDLARRENKSDIIAGADLTGYAPEVSRVLIDLAQNDTNRESWYLARNLVGELKKQIRLLRTSHRYAGFAVLKSPNVPSALIELGYLSNRTDEKNLQKPRYRRRIGEALLRAIDRYFVRKDQNSRS